MRFTDIPGLENTKERLVSGVKSNHVAHAQLFYGQEGTPNLALALAYAAFLNCENQGETDSCGKCPSCIKTDKLIHPDLHFVFPVSTTDKFKSAKEAVCENFMKEWRAFLLENPYPVAQDWLEYFGFENKQGNISKDESRQIIKALSLKAFEGKYKIMLIWLPEFMHPAAANAILKILEEPPAGTLFLLVSNSFEKLLTTIISRTQKINIPKFADNELALVLTKHKGLNLSEANDLALQSDGSLQEALRILSDHEDDGSLGFAKWMRSCWQMEFKPLVQNANDFFKMSRVAQKSLLIQHLSILRNIILAKYSESLIKVREDDLQFIHKFNKATTMPQLEALVKEINNAVSYLEQNGNAKIVFLDVSLKATTILRAS